MGYILPHTPVQLIQYQSRINFQRWPSVSDIERVPKLNTDGRSKGFTREQYVKMMGKGGAVDEKV